MADPFDPQDLGLGPTLLTDFLDLSRADKSVLIAAFDRTGLDETPTRVFEAAVDAPMVTTAPGCANYDYWEKLTKLRWALDVTENLPAEFQGIARGYVLTNLGKMSVASVLRRAAELN